MSYIYNKFKKLAGQTMNLFNQNIKPTKLQTFEAYNGFININKQYIQQTCEIDSVLSFFLISNTRVPKKKICYTSIITSIKVTTLFYYNS